MSSYTLFLNTLGIHSHLQRQVHRCALQKKYMLHSHSRSLLKYCQIIQIVSIMRLLISFTERYRTMHILKTPRNISSFNRLCSSCISYVISYYDFGTTVVPFYFSLQYYNYYSGNCCSVKYVLLVCSSYAHELHCSLVK